jgi:hypothetical protein
MKSFICSMLLCCTAAVVGQAKPVDALARIYKHKDGTRTETKKDGDKNEIHEKTYRNNVLIIKRVFYCDSKGRTRQGVVFDGRNNPLGTILYGYDKTTDQLVEEQQYNKDAKLVRRLFYPGALKDSRYANRYVALTIDPDDATRQPKWETANVQPTRPVESDQDEFTPGIPLGTGAPSALQPAPHSRTPAVPAVPPAPGKQQRKRFLAPRKS